MIVACTPLLAPINTAFCVNASVIPNAVLECLHGHKDLGIHTEMFSDGLIPLVEKGVITGKYKTKHPTKIVSSFIHGSKKVYDFINNNTQV